MASMSREAALQDISRLVEVIAESHPDPFRHLSSQVAFYERAGAVAAELKGETVAQSDFYLCASRIAALVGDGHTSVDSVDEGVERLWLDMEPLDGRLVVTGVYGGERSELLGAFVNAVEGVGMEALSDRIRTVRGSDGLYNDLEHITGAFRSRVLSEYLLQKEVAKPLNVELKGPAGGTSADLEFAAGKPGGLVVPRTAVELPEPGRNDMAWAMLPGKAAVYLRIDSMRRYRENFESQFALGASEAFLKELLARAGFEAGGDIERSIQAVPPATETVIEALAAMKENGVTSLVVDLRRNTGGNSYLAYVLAHFLYGERMLDADQGYDVRRHSRLYGEQFPGRVAEERERGGYDFGEMRRWATGKRGMDREEAGKAAALSPTFRRLAGSFEPVRDVDAYVLTSARTYSAGFDLAFLLKQLGAVVVGVQPAQPANAFVDTLRFSLPNSGLKGWVSSKLMMKRPTEPLHHCLRPDVELTYEEFEGFGFDPNSSLLLALRSIGKARRR
ncbi:MAG: S41 family peptidase [Thaumarchaeota archaeon]|nr:S41 family peptidase [Nitrososphaerota archaeon]